MKSFQGATKRLYDLFLERITALKRGQKSRIAVAFSGGPDSTAIALIASLYHKSKSLSAEEEQVHHVGFEPLKSGRGCRQEWSLEEWRPLYVRMLDHLQSRLQPLKLTQSLSSLSSKDDVLALIVDHGLRPESKMEAHQASLIATELGLVPSILTIDWGRDGQGHVKKQHRMQRARNERYKVLLQKCIEENVKILLVAHHAEDVVEGFLMRLLRGSGIDGLAGMEEVSIQRLSQTQEDEVVICRPFLSASKKDLIECLKENGVSWIEDSSNFDASYFRVKIRNFLKEMEERNSTQYSTFVNDVLRVNSVCKQIRHEQESQTWNLFKAALIRHNMTHTTRGDNPFLDLDVSKLRDSGEDLNRRLFSAVVRALRPSRASKSAGVYSENYSFPTHPHQFSESLYKADLTKRF